MAAYAYYNELDPYAAVWLRNLIAEGLIAPGDVDERDVGEVQPDDLRGYTQCHLFAGVGGWSYALRLAGWPDGRPVWTGSCPCQPLSSAGRRQGHADRRHLWPAFFRLIAECRPATIFGEQVASALGREWLAGVRADLEHLGYACGAADLPAACVGAPHIRQRLWWCASRLADADGAGRVAGQSPASAARHGGATESAGDAGGMGDASVGGGGPLDGEPGSGTRPQEQTRGSGLPIGVGDADGNRLPERAGFRGVGTQAGVEPSRVPAQSAGAWSEYDLIPCADGQARRVEPGTFPLADGVPARVGRLRAYGNAIVPQTAAVFIEAFLGAEVRA